MIAKMVSCDGCGTEGPTSTAGIGDRSLLDIARARGWKAPAIAGPHLCPTCKAKPT